MTMHHPSDEQIYTLHPRVALESFDEGGLVFRLDDRRLLELNPTAQFILENTNGTRTVKAIAQLLAQAFEIADNEAFADVNALYAELVAQNIVRLYHNRKSQVGDIMTQTFYVRNPDVGLREEDEDGGLLFNPDTRGIQAVNTTGLFIWRLCDGTRTLQDVAAAMVQEYEGAELEDVTPDAQAFIDMMVAIGFLGVVVENVDIPAGEAVNHG